MSLKRLLTSLIPAPLKSRLKKSRRSRQLRRALRLISPCTTNFKSLLSPPPPNDSLQTQSELVHLLELQNSRDPAEVRQAASEAFLTGFEFSSILGPWFTAKNLPKTAALMRELILADTAIVEPIKAHFSRQRPYQIDPRIKPCIPLDPTAGYPSGHAARTRILALTLAEIFPDQKSQLLSLADRIPQLRIMAGLHFPSDIAAGKLIGEKIFEAMTQSPAYQSALAQVRAECLSVRNK